MSKDLYKLNKTQFSKLAGITLAGISMAISRKTIHLAVKGTNRNARIDVHHPQVVVFLHKKGIDVPGLPPMTDAEREALQPKKVVTAKKESSQSKPPKPPRRKPPKEKENKDTGVLDLLDDDIRMYLDWSLRKIVMKFGTLTNFKDFLDSTKKMEDIHASRLKNAATEGDLVKRAIVKNGVIDPINSAHLKLLSDGSTTIARRAVGMIESGRDTQEVKRMVEDQLKSFISPIKKKIIRTLMNA